MVYSDVIYDEYKTIIEGKTPINKYPTNKTHFIFNDGSKETALLLSSIGDSLSTGSIDTTIKYISEINVLIDDIDSAKVNLKYERSKIGIQLWEIYLLEVLNNYLEATKISEDNVKEAIRYLDNDNNLLYYKITYKNNDLIFKRYWEALSYQNEFIKLSNKAEYVTIVLFPTTLLLYFFSK